MLTALEDDEYIESVRFPLSKNDDRFAFAEFGRRHGDFAIVAIAAAKTDEGVSVTVGGVNDVPLKVSLGQLVRGDIIESMNDIAWQLDARSDLHASAALRRSLVRELGKRTLNEVLA